MAFRVKLDSLDTLRWGLKIFIILQIPLKPLHYPVQSRNAAVGAAVAREAVRFFGEMHHLHFFLKNRHILAEHFSANIVVLDSTSRHGGLSASVERRILVDSF